MESAVILEEEVIDRKTRIEGLQCLIAMVLSKAMSAAQKSWLDRSDGGDYDCSRVRYIL